ncbi:outer membrane protein assembly factor BamA [Pseudidiomarina marina]|uniref:Outer membrane protein assembly factor BamA n=1 Tax=Pseudidiomarina marina TaxID=502366 RepID=A0A432YK28_9GAMM|nr:outer membrane protein assembly factor BamA [Pseudidiomarina marina]PHR64902.1 MAG: outer membrane protein assembly factor BamA [Idiomarina sp.]RUO61323.1 outer membrane protein assembly factor BamA [Pseudidiomarina marina]
MTLKQLFLSALVAAASLPAYEASSAENNSQINFEKFVVEDIRVRGLQRVALGAALTYIPIRVGDEVDASRIRASIRSLNSAAYFENIVVKRDGNTLVFEVIERPTIASIEFDGNKEIKDEQLEESLTDSGIVVGEQLDRTMISSIETGLEDFFHGVGKYNASVEINVIELPRNRVRLELKFEEGDSAEIQQINIVGNSSFTDEQLLADFELKDKLPWWNFIGERRYQKQQLSGDLEKLESFYRNRGYLAFQIESVQVSMTPDREGVYITINVNEGEVYDVREVNVIGDLKGHDDVIKRLTSIDPGTRYNAEQITFLEDAISRYYGRFGYAYPEVRAIPDMQEGSNEVDLTFSVNPGQRIYVDRINFIGNNITADEVLRREMRQLEGAPLNDQLIEQSKVRLERLGYFETVETSTRKSDTEDDRVEVDFTVKEQPSGSFNFTLGYGDYSGFQIGLGLSQENFLGSGNRAAINVNTNRYNKSASVSYTDRYLTKDGVSLSGQLYVSEFDAGNLENYIRYNKKQYGIGSSIGFPINEVTSLNFGATYRNEQISNVDSYEQVSRFYRPYLDEQNPNLGVKFDIFELSAGISRVTLNRGMFPTAGSSNSLSVEVATPNSDVNYFRTNYDYRQYFPITDSHSFVFMTRLRIGYGNGYGTDENGNEYLFPFYENFRLGGRDNLRGFEGNTIGPRAIYRYPQTIPGQPGYDGIPPGLPAYPGADQVAVSQYSVGGNAMAVGGLELIVPTPFISEENKNTVRTSFYIDVGNVWDTEFDYATYSQLELLGNSEPLKDYSEPSHYRAAAGISIQWISPMGPITLSFGRPIKSEETDRTQTFTFNIGTTF